MIRIRGLCKEFLGKRVLDNITADFRKGEFAAVVGPSGCGKTTLLRLISGLESPTSGRIDIRSESVGFVFQEPSLFPWRSVKENVMFGPEVLGIGGSDVGRIIEMVGLTGSECMTPDQLSGGMKQRAALARSLATDPSVLLIDEPFSSLDDPTRHALRKQLLKVWVSTKKTIIFVTHNIEEAVFLADRIFILSKQPARIIKVMEMDLDRDKRMFSKSMLPVKKEVMRLLQ